VIKNSGVLGHYDKTRLVPFGEFIPFRSILPSFVQKITYGRGDFMEGGGAKTLTFDGISPFSPLICYEIIFPDYVTNKRQRPEWLLNVTNDGWFGISSGPYQHLLMSRVRSIEYGLPLVRVANTGISVVTDSYGRIIASIPLGEAGITNSKLPISLKETIYSKYRKFIILFILIGFTLITCFVFRGIWNKKI
jgi:apolipoprotein N-acyltransferase